MHLLPIPDDEFFLANSLGAKLGKAVFLWAATLEWPHEDLQSSCDYNNQIVGSWGISHLELLINFILVTGFYFPVRVSGSAGSSKFVQYFSEEAMLLPPHRRSAGAQIQSMQACLTCLSTLSQLSMIPSYRKKGHTSLQRIHFNSHVGGVSRRPKMHLPQETLHEVVKYIHGLGNLQTVHAPLDVSCSSPLISISWQLEEPCPQVRFQNYARVMMRRKRNSK